MKFQKSQHSLWHEILLHAQKAYLTIFSIMWPGFHIGSITLTHDARGANPAPLVNVRADVASRSPTWPEVSPRWPRQGSIARYHTFHTTQIRYPISLLKRVFIYKCGMFNLYTSVICSNRNFWLCVPFALLAENIMDNIECWRNFAENKR